MISNFMTYHKQLTAITSITLILHNKVNYLNSTFFYSLSLFSNGVTNASIDCKYFILWEKCQLFAHIKLLPLLSYKHWDDLRHLLQKFSRILCFFSAHYLLLLHYAFYNDLFGMERATAYFIIQFIHHKCI